MGKSASLTIEEYIAWADYELPEEEAAAVSPRRGRLYRGSCAARRSWSWASAVTRHAARRSRGQSASRLQKRPRGRQLRLISRRVAQLEFFLATIGLYRRGRRRVAQAVAATQFII